MRNTWGQLLADKRVWLGSLIRCREFRDLVEHTAPDIIEEQYDEILTFERLTELQHQIVETLAKKSGYSQHKHLATALSSHRNKPMFLAVHNTSEQAYCLQMRGMRGSEFAKMKRGELTVGQLYRQNPTVFFAPLLPKNKRRIN